MKSLKVNNSARLCICLLLSLLVGCGGSGDDESGQSVTANSGSYDPTRGGFPALAQLPTNNTAMTSCKQLDGPAGATLSGSLAYERRPMAAAAGLEANLVELPIRGVVVEALRASGGECSDEVIATTLSDGNGEYGFTLDDSVPVCIQARAQLFRSRSSGGAGWDIQVTDNTNDNAPYYLRDDTAATAAERPIRDLLASAGWDGVDYTQERVAGPFALLDTSCEVVDVLVNPIDGLEQGSQLPDLKLRWSENNTPAEGDLAEGEIDTAFFRRSLGVNELFLRGDKAVNTDEYDPHVIVHELGHYVSASFLRSDSLGGQHSLSEQLDLTTAFEEGWANAFAAMVLDGQMVNGNEVLFRDSLGDNGNDVGGFWLDTRASWESVRGWFSEGSVHRILYNIYDSDNSSLDRVSLSLPAIYQALQAHSSTTALSSIFSFSQALRNSHQISASDMFRLLSAEDIDGVGDRGVGESNDGGNVDGLPIYTNLLPGQTLTLCTNNEAGVVNRLGNYRYLAFQATMSTDYFITVETTGDVTENDGVASLEVFDQGNFVTAPVVASGPGVSISQRYDLSSGDYVIALAHYDNTLEEGDSPGRKCFELSLN